VVPTDGSLLSLSVPGLGIDGAVLSVIGQMASSYGVVLFQGLEDYRAFCACSPGFERGEQPRPPRHFALNFENKGDVPKTVLGQIRDRGWEVAGKRAYPVSYAVDEDLVTRPLDAKEITLFEAIARALPSILGEDEEALLAAWDGGEPVVRTVSVRTFAGEYEVRLTTVNPAPPKPSRPADDLLARLFDLAQTGDGIEAEARAPLEAKLLRRFAASPEAEGLVDIVGCQWLMDCAANCVGATIATLDPDGLEEVVFEIIPRQVSIRASHASEVVEAIRAFYAFLGRECALEQADACLDRLGKGAAKRLEAALKDPRNFGMAKSVLMAGEAAGYDIESREGLEEWLDVVRSGSGQYATGG
jgi:hypothetical protein